MSKKNEEEILKDKEDNCRQDEQNSLGDGENSEKEREEECEKETLQDDLDDIKFQLKKKSEECEQYIDRLQRVMAEYDNFKKRTAREKESLYADAVSDVVTAFLPVIDSIDRAIETCSGESDKGAIKEGIELLKKQVDNVLDNLGVEEIKCVGESFNPELHNAVMHIEDEQHEQNVVVEEFQKGYVYKDKVIRYSMVKVAN